MKWHQLSEEKCPIAKSLSLLGDRWTLLIIRNAFMRTRRFDDFQKQLGVTRHLLASRLKRLVDAQVFEKVLYQEAPKRYEYKLTTCGLALYPVLITLSSWGSDWMIEDSLSSDVSYIHTKCGQVTKPLTTCSCCGEVLHATEIMPLINPKVS